MKINKYNTIQPKALVTDGLWRKSISVIRSLGKQNIYVTVCAESLLTTGRWSKFTSKTIKIPTINTNEEVFDSKILSFLANEKDRVVLFPMEDASLIWCSENYNKIKEKVYILLPPKESLEIAENKALTIKQAINNNIPCPKTFFPATPFELINLISEFEGDFVIKPYHGSGSSGLIYGSDVDNYDLEDHWKKYGNLILQERIPSEGYGCGMSILMDKNSEVIAYFGHKRLEQYPNSGGPSTQRIGIKDEYLLELSVKLLKSLKWIGVAMVEWKYNPETEEMVLMEINPRFWGSLELAVRSGVDFPYLYYQLAIGKSLKPITEYRTDLVCRWLLPGDILRYLSKKNKEKLKIFLKDILKQSEEWDKKDIRCFFASFICQILLAINPKYWKYIRR
ncbi:MAG: ATP-grasp domain-containing protein [Bacilli bacterium]|nr:ATP-grasp domain-containing protein [Bacilli bacterium]